MTLALSTLKSGVLKTLTHFSPMARSVQPTVASAKSPLATWVGVGVGVGKEGDG